MTTAPYTKTFARIVADYAAAAQAASTTPLKFVLGSIWLAFAEATAGVADWLQKLYLFALSVTRLQSSQGVWVDSWIADFNLLRLPARPATGLVTFSRAAFQAQAIVPVGAEVATFDNSQVFSVYADATNAAYSASIIPGGGYVIAAGIASLDVPVQAETTGAIGNVLANTITLLRSSVVGVDTVTNAAPLTNGLDQETDAQVKARFPLFILSLRAATEGAIGFAITSLQQGLQYKIHGNIDPDGTIDYGSVVVYIDDGSGSPSSTLVQLAATAVNGIRAAGVRPQVIAASPVLANINFAITTAPGYNHALLVAAASNAVGAYVNGLGLEATLPYTELAHVAYSASPGITNVTSITLNGSTADLVPAMGRTVKVGTLTVS